MKVVTVVQVEMMEVTVVQVEMTVVQVEMKIMVQMVKVEMTVMAVQMEEVEVEMSLYLGEQRSLLPLFLQAVSHQPLHGFGTVAANLAEVWREVAPPHHEDYLQEEYEEYDMSTT